MKNKLYVSTGICLSLGSVLLIATMILHPTGGDIPYLLGISSQLKVSHSIGICSVPISLFGFYGLTVALLDRYKFSVLGFVFVSIGLIAALLAALLNGIILPKFIEKFSGQLSETGDILEIFVAYNFTLNTAFDYIFIVGGSLAIAIYSSLMLRSVNFPSLLGYAGLIILFLAGIALVFNLPFTSLLGFRFFTLTVAGWIGLVGIIMFNSK